ncbi:FAD binding domain-containing protein [Colletotrichum graminicola]|uniref:FAD binding domain-containing protein n=1 Tax=Colletotrichum graminicola (strain M1.001 / M2 / FGSC 10212) TaxID=645133 RepID=E3Q2B6_COLGM|nr:FAD binding domain-containing protein [Colletotrichum graminicola M1.001]EFQ25217.1 FAD binding domain-containing protein [Colletotrichum graminicola M1.001]WDK15157.1 FAD binding domain-containing protein [Colletotrichum graminicola]
MTKLHDVIIAGAGPVGLLLACELGLAGTAVLVLERDKIPESPWKTTPLGFRGLQTSAIETFHRRALLDKFFDLSNRPHSPPKEKGGNRFGGHFAGIPLNIHKLDLARHRYRLPGPSLMPAPTTIDKIEAILTERAESLGAEILRGQGFDHIVQKDDSGLTIETECGKQFRTRWLVGCDGGRSRVRKAAGFDFVGSEPTLTGYSLRCDLDHPEKLKMGFNTTETGFYIFTGFGMFALLDFDGGASQARKQELTQEYMQGVLERVLNRTDVHITKIHLVSTWTDRSKQTTNFREGRVLLAGDAAHIHPPFGAQGMNAGLGDAMNLGWKLAATIQGEKCSEDGLFHSKLLDTYEKERHPVGASVLDWNRAQAATMQPTPTGRALRALASDLIDTDDGVNHFIDRVWGLSQRYSLSDDADEHPLVGHSAPDFTFTDGSRLNPKLEKGQGLLLDFGKDQKLKAVIDLHKCDIPVEYLNADSDVRLGISALLIRCDGFVAWVAEESSDPDVARLTAALDMWYCIR